MNQSLLRLIAVGFGALVLLQSLLGVVVLYLNIGILPSEIELYYATKSFHGLIEVILPHTLFIAIALMVLIHFLAFMQSISQKTKEWQMHSLFTLFILDQGSPFLIAQGYEIFAYVKLGSFLGFEVLLVWVWLGMFRGVILNKGKY